jgi:DNA replication protein DnaC
VTAASIGDALRRAGLRLVASSGQALWPVPDYCPACGQAPCLCPACHGAGWLRQPVAAGEPSRPAVGCSCAARRRQVAATAAVESVLGDYRAATFDAFEPLDQLADAHAAAVAYAARGSGWLLLHGPPGVGKTHLAAAVGNELAGRGEAVAMQVVPALLREMRRCFAASDAGDKSGSRRFHDLFDAVASAPVLILDDLGAEYGTKWAIEQTFLLVEERYRRRLPLVVTTNTYAALEPRVKDRLSDDGLAVVVAINAPSYRQRPVKFRRGASS